MRSAMVVLAACVAATSVAAAPSTEELFNEFGLFGRWAYTCNAPAAPDNPHVTISAPTAGLVLEDHDLGSDYSTNRYSVIAARKVGRERLSVDVIFQPGAPGEERQTLEYLVRGETRRTIFNKTEAGVVRVKDGRAVAARMRTPLLRKCEAKE